jgi:plasmid stabilization system protein ParE
VNKYRITKAAARDLRRIRSRLTREASEEVADHVETKLFEGFEELARLPWIGHVHLDASDGTLLFYYVFEYAIVFRRDAELTIARVVHGRRDLKRIL